MQLVQILQTITRMPLRSVDVKLHIKLSYPRGMFSTWYSFITFDPILNIDFQGVKNDCKQIFSQIFILWNHFQSVLPFENILETKSKLSVLLSVFTARWRIFQGIRISQSIRISFYVTKFIIHNIKEVQLFNNYPLKLQKNCKMLKISQIHGSET